MWFGFRCEVLTYFMFWSKLYDKTHQQICQLVAVVDVKWPQNDQDTRWPFWWVLMYWIKWKPLWCCILQKSCGWSKSMSWVTLIKVDVLVISVSAGYDINKKPDSHSHMNFIFKYAHNNLLMFGIIHILHRAIIILFTSCLASALWATKVLLSSW